MLSCVRLCVIIAIIIFTQCSFGISQGMPEKGCYNDHVNCVKWAFDGACTAEDTKTFMNVFCRLSCGACTQENEDYEYVRTFARRSKDVEVLITQDSALCKLECNKAVRCYGYYTENEFCYINFADEYGSRQQGEISVSLKIKRYKGMHRRETLSFIRKRAGCVNYKHSAGMASMQKIKFPQPIGNRSACEAQCQESCYGFDYVPRRNVCYLHVIPAFSLGIFPTVHEKGRMSFTKEYPDNYFYVVVESTRGLSSEKLDVSVEHCQRRCDERESCYGYYFSPPCYLYHISLDELNWVHRRNTKVKLFWDLIPPKGRSENKEYYREIKGHFKRPDSGRGHQVFTVNERKDCIKKCKKDLDCIAVTYFQSRKEQNCFKLYTHSQKSTLIKSDDTYYFEKIYCGNKEGFLANWNFDGTERTVSLNGANYSYTSKDNENFISFDGTGRMTPTVRIPVDMFGIKTKIGSDVVSAITIHVKFRLNRLNTAVYIFSDGTNYTQPNYLLRLDAGDGSIEFCSVYLFEPYSCIYGGNLLNSLNDWHKVTVMIDLTSQEVSLYHNGRSVCVPKKFKAYSIPKFSILQLGWNSAGTFSFDGDISELRIYNFDALKYLRATPIRIYYGYAKGKIGRAEMGVGSRSRVPANLRFNAYKGSYSCVNECKYDHECLGLDYVYAEQQCYKIKVAYSIESLQPDDNTANYAKALGCFFPGRKDEIFPGNFQKKYENITLLWCKRSCYLDDNCQGVNFAFKNNLIGDCKIVPKIDRTEEWVKTNTSSYHEKTKCGKIIKEWWFDKYDEGIQIHQGASYTSLNGVDYLHFNGIMNFVMVPAIQFGTFSWTLCIRFYLHVVNKEQYIISYSQHGYVFRLQVLANNRISLMAKEIKEWQYNIEGGNVADPMYRNDWQTTCFNWDQDKRLGTLYLNGEKQKEVTGKVPDIVNNDYIQDKNFFMIGFNPTTYSNNFQGDLEYIVIFEE